MAQILGRGVVYGSDGTVTLAGVAQVNTAQTATLSDKSEVKKIKDARGKVQTLLKPENIKQIQFKLMPGGTTATAATLAEAKAQGTLVTKLSKMVTSSFGVSAFNDNWIIDEDSSVEVTSEGELIVNVTGTRYERDFTLDTLTTI